MAETRRTVGALAMRFKAAAGASELSRVPRNSKLSSANARLVLLRSVVAAVDDGVFTLDDGPIHRWATQLNLGQGAQAGVPPAAGDKHGASSRSSKNPAGLVDAVARRREAAVAALAADGLVHVRTLELEVQAAIVTGTGAGGVRDVGIELHGTYGWPILPGSTLKGVAREWARQISHPRDEIEAIFGSVPEAEDPVPGQVSFFDALPWRHGVEVVDHVLTPHTRGYRSDTGNAGPTPPGEHLNPVPIPFLAVERGRFVAHLSGPQNHVDAAADLLTEAIDQLGVGAKTAAGYGYLTVSPPRPDELDREPVPGDTPSGGDEKPSGRKRAR
jgi:CRISPR type III-B/RAMP module RAMP protein Cmr6